ncbi:hypothetical protein RM863_38420 [Streptomyces sp. DSM 41014]|uniref:Uncharacterized protein n=1 Tax=Streptomyces hintoniae TaxID=3075521 RepID=A0ABU2UXI0_9ACTN|nr:hypothetical protein [Streptomyces sp. DSM 41014]MDT0478008.1 hypothetical protein [Streptomyces sp. DSM 41014]
MAWRTRRQAEEAEGADEGYFESWARVADTRPEVAARLGATLSEFDAQHGGARAPQPATA